MDNRNPQQVAVGYQLLNLIAGIGATPTSAKVRLFPDVNTGIQITDGTKDVFKCLTGGADAGDVIIGSTSGQYVKWDNSAGKLLINGELAAGTVTVSMLNFTPLSSSNVLASINASTEGIRITGDRLSITSSTTFTADVEIQGLLSASGGMKTSSDASHVEMGKFGAGNRDVIKGFNDDGNLTLQIYADAGGKYARIYLYEPDDTDKGTRIYTGSLGIIYGSKYASLQMSGTDYPELVMSGGSGVVCKLGTADGGWADMGSEYRVAGVKVVGARGAAVADATDAASTMARLNDLLARCRAHGLIAT